MMPRYALVVAFVLLLSPAAAAEGGYHATYRLMMGPLTVGKMERSFEVQADGTYRFVSKLKATGLASIVNRDELLETSSGAFELGTYRPDQYNYVRKNKKKPRVISMYFDRENANVKTIVNGETMSSPLSENLLDKLIYQAALMHDLGLGKTDLGYRIADRGKEKLYRPVFMEQERIKTDIGEFDTMKIVRRRSKDKRRTTFWCAAELAYLPVRVAYREKDGKETIAVLTEYDRIDGGSPAAARRLEGR